MLHSTFNSAYSISAHAGAAGGAALNFAIVWWPLAMALSVLYFIVVFREFRGKVRISKPPRPAASGPG
jgi:cytochrome oxidase assembly protein ShyY1